MTIYNIFKQSGVQFSDYTNLVVTKSLSDNNRSSSFNAQFDSPYGRHKTDFNVGQGITIYADKDTNPPTTLQFTGILEEVKFNGEGLEERVELSGRDYTARLQDATVDPVVYTDSEISTIVTDIITNNVQDVTTVNVANTGIILPRISFFQINVFDALTQLAQLANYSFYVDTGKDLNFQPKGASATGFIFDNTNIDRLEFDKSRENMANIFYVYGDRYLDNFKETITAGSPLGGSIFTLAYKPHNTEVTVSGAAIQPGGIYGMTDVNASGTKYLVSYDDKQIIFTSGTKVGANIPTSGNAVVIQYKRDLPIVKYGQEDNSIALYGPKTKVITDKAIKDPATATEILKQQLSDTDPTKEITCEIRGWYNVVPGQTAQIIMPNFNINDTYPILEATYHFDPNSVQTEKVVNMRFNKKIYDITDQFAALKRRLDLMDAQDRQTTDTITRLQQMTGSLSIVGSYWEVRVCSNLGSTFEFGHQIMGKLGSQTIQPVLGYSKGPFTLVASGGNY